MSRYVVQAGWKDAPHLSQEDIDDMARGISPHQLEARMNGVPTLGSGAIYPVPEEDIVVEPFQLPDWWARIYGLDVGWKKTAGIWGAIDRDADILYLYSEHYRGHAEPTVHAKSIKMRGSWIPGIIDYAGTNQSDGKRVMTLYEGEGLNLIRADKSVEAGLLEVLDRLSTGRLKVFSTLQHWLAEYRLYRRDDKGRVVKENDHLMDATRYLVMKLHEAMTRPVQQAAQITAPGDPTAGY